MGPMRPPSSGGLIGAPQRRNGGGFKPEELSALLSALATWNARPDVRLLVLTEAELMAGGWVAGAGER